MGHIPHRVDTHKQMYRDLKREKEELEQEVNKLEEQLEKNRELLARTNHLIKPFEDTFDKEEEQA